MGKTAGSTSRECGARSREVGAGRPRPGAGRGPRHGLEREELGHIRRGLEIQGDAEGLGREEHCGCKM